jgi:exonuclease SbcC
VQLHRLHLVNFRLHADTELVLGPGITAIVGPNGAGKSTLLEGIAWAFYGTNAARGSRDTIRRLGAPPRAPVRVEVDFTLGPHEYRVVRGLYSAELYQDGSTAPVANSQQAVTNAMGRLLGMSHSEFFNTYFTGQKELTVMAAMGPSDRAKFLSRLMGYERLRLAQRAIRNKRSELKAEIAGLETGLESEEALRKDHEHTQERVKAARKRAREAARELEKTRTTWHDVEPRWKAVTELRESVRSLQSERAIAEQRVIEARREFERLDKDLAEALHARSQLSGMKEDLHRAESLQAELARLDREAAAAGRRRTLATQRAEVRARVETITKAMADLGDVEAALRTARTSVTDGQRALNDARHGEEQVRTKWAREKAHAESKRNTLLDQYRDLQDHRKSVVEAGAEGECPTCKRPLGTEYEVVLATLVRQLDDVESQGKFYKQRLKQLDLEPEEVKHVREAREQASRGVDEAVRVAAAAEAQSRRVVEYQEELTRLGDRTAQIEREMSELPDSYDPERHDTVREALRELGDVIRRGATLQVRAERAEALVKEAETAERELSDREARVTKLTETITSSGFSMETFEQVKGEFERADAGQRTAELAAASAHGDLKAAETALEAVDRRRKERAERVKKVVTLRRDVTLHDELDTALEALRAELNARLRPDLSEIASALLAELTEGRYHELELDENYQLSVIEDGLPKPVISGGEEDICNLVLRLAVSQMVAERAGQPLSMLVLDEIFGSLDEFRRRGIVELLRGLADRFPQVVLITHIEGIKADRVLRVAVDVKARLATIAEDEEPIAHEDAA